MSLGYEMGRRANEIRDRLRNPPNAVPDRGIDLRRGKSLPQPVKPQKIIFSPPAKEPIKLYAPAKPQKTITIAQIVYAVADFYLVGAGEIRGRARHAYIIHPRQMVFYLAWKLSGLSLGQIGLSMHRDHTTVMYGRDIVRNMVNAGELTDAIRSIEGSLLAGHYD